jgi:hypothetical protein
MYIACNGTAPCVTSNSEGLQWYFRTVLNIISKEFAEGVGLKMILGLI